MPTYLIEGKKVKAAKPLSDEEIDEIAASIKPAQVAAPAPQRGPSLGDIGDRATGFRAQVAETGMTPEERQEAVRTGAAFAGGIALGPVLGGIVRGVGAAIPAFQRAAPTVATSLESGGFRTGLPSTAGRAQQLTVRAGGGAVTGGGAAALMEPEDTGTGAAVGAGISTLAPPVARIVSKGASSVIDALAGKTADVRANELIRLAANNEVNALRAAMAANPDVPASRAAAELNLPVLQALLQRAEQRDPRQVVNAFRQRESQDIVNQLARIAGGPTAETARVARETAKESLGELTGRMREGSLAAAGRTGEVMPKLQTIATEARAEVKKSVDFVRRFSDAVNRAEDWSRNWITQSRLVQGPDGTFTRQYLTNQGVGEAGVRLPERTLATSTFPGQLAASGRQTTIGGPFERMVIDEGGTVARRIDEAAEASRQAGARARVAESTLQSMRDRGLEPITIDKFTAPIDALLRNPDVATNPTLKTALPQIRQMFQDWTNEFGVITPEAVAAIRKNGVNGVIQQLMPTADAKAQSAMAAQVLTKLRPAIDEAIEKAGGKEWTNYLRSFEQGMSSIKGMELADQIRQLYAQGTTESKQQIINLVRGESPDVIEELFGSGRYQISKEMAKDMPFLQKLADTLELDAKVVKQAAAGRAALTEAEKKSSVRLRFPFFTRVSTAVNEVVAGLEQRMKAETLDVLVRAAQSGREFNRVLNQIPASERNVFLTQFKDAETWNNFAGQIAQASQAQAVTEPRNKLAPPSENQLRP